ncbi:MAG: MazG nucleotide pyrophosphohydrolase domain-containing protein, partial [bacterium]
LDWQNPEQLFPVIMDEMDELIMAMRLNSSEGKEYEMGDVLFSCVNLSRHLGIDPDMALRKSNRRFIQRLEYMENQLKNGAEDLKKMSPSELNSYWLEAKVVLSEE